MERGLKRDPAFNERPMVAAAAGLGAGIAVARYMQGTYAFIALCLLFIMASSAFFLKRRMLTVFIGATALGFLRVLPYLLAEPARALGDSTVFALANAKLNISSFFEELSQTLLARCDALFKEASPLVRAILLGDTTMLSFFDNEAFRAAGVSHILALSGLNASIFAQILALFIPKRRPGVRFALIAAFLFVYCALAAFPASLLRACVMALCIHAAPLFGRKNDPLSSLALAFVFIVLPLPFWMFSAGFILSFSATAGVVMLYAPLCEKLAKLPEPLAADVSVTLSATLSTLPFTLQLFGRLPLYSLVSNLLIVPLVTLSMPLSLAALLLSFVWFPLGEIAAFPARLLADASDYLSKAFASLPYSVLSIEKPSPAAGVLFLAALVFLSKFCLLENKKRYPIAFALLASSALCLIFL